MRSTLLVLLLLAAPAVFAQGEGPARQVLEECVEALDPDVIGLQAIESTCPDIRGALEELGLTELVADSQLSLLSRDGLHSIVSLVARYEQTPEREAIGSDSLAAVLDSLRTPPEIAQSLSWFERFKRWLREIFQRKEMQSGQESWLSRWLEEHPLPEVVRSVLFYASIAAVVLLALGIIINEVRTAMRGRRRRISATATDSTEVTRELTPAAFAVETSGERPSALLRLLIATLVKTGRLTGAPSLTHRELAKRARFDDSSQRESFQKIAQLAEREVFSGKELPSDDLVEAVRAGRNLDAQLNGAAT